MEIVLVVAVAENGVIGTGSDIPWKVKGEQSIFKAITCNQTILMGRKTYETIGKPLPDRKNVVITRNPRYEAPGCTIYPSLEVAIKELEKSEELLFIAGGGEIYEQTIGRASTIHYSLIHAQVEGDIKFSAIPDDFKLVFQQHYKSNIDYTYKIYQRSL